MLGIKASLFTICLIEHKINWNGLWKLCKGLYNNWKFLSTLILNTSMFYKKCFQVIHLKFFKSHAMVVIKIWLLWYFVKLNLGSYQINVIRLKIWTKNFLEDTEQRALVTESGCTWTMTATVFVNLGNFLNVHQGFFSIKWVAVKMGWCNVSINIM